MRYRLAVRLGLLALLAKLALPTLAAAQSTPSLTPPLSEAAIQLPIAQPSPVLLQSAVRTRDSVVNGMLIGAGIGAVVGMLIAPPAFCGAHDTECATIVRVAIGLPSIAGGLGIGALVDALNSKNARPAGVAVNVRW